MWFDDPDGFDAMQAQAEAKAAALDRQRHGRPVVAMPWRVASRDVHLPRGVLVGVERFRVTPDDFRPPKSSHR
jgi:hypothetical protein